MAWWAAAALGIQAGSSLVSFLGAGNQARQQRLETKEQVRRLRLQQEATLSTARAAGAASGVEFGSESLQLYLGAMDAEFRRQADWMKKAGYKRAATTEQAGALGFVSDLGGALFQYGAANNWWRKTPGSAT